MKIFPITKQVAETFNNVASILQHGKSVLDDTELLRVLMHELTYINTDVRDEIAANMENPHDQKTFDEAIKILNGVNLRGIDTYLYNMGYLNADVPEAAKGDIGAVSSLMRNDIEKAGFTPLDKEENPQTLLLSLYVIFRSRVESVYVQIADLVDQYDLAEDEISKYFLSVEKITFGKKGKKPDTRATKQEIYDGLFPYFTSEYKGLNGSIDKLFFLAERIGELANGSAKDIATVAYLLTQSEYFKKPCGGWLSWYRAFCKIVKCKSGKYDNTKKLAEYSQNPKFSSLKSYL